MLHPHHLTECYETFRNILGDHKEHFVYFEIFISVTLGQVTFWGPACNFEVTNGFSSITFNWIEIETPFDVYRVCLVNADRMICNMTNFGQVMTLTWGQMFNLTFRGQVIHHSMRLDELRTMACESFLYLCWIKSYYRKTIRNENEHFFFGDLWWPSFWPDRKNDRSSFLLILTALSNAACRLSLRRSGVELDGGRKTAPPPRHGALQMEPRPGAG